MTDSYHYQSVPKFRVGGVYRQKNGDVMRLDDPQNNWITAAEDEAAAYSITIGYIFGARRLSDGMAYPYDDRESKYNLIPGELIQRDGQWVAADAPIVFPSGAAVLTSGDKIVGRVEAETAESLPDCPQCGYGPAYCNCKYLRAPLPHFNQRTEFDPFPDYVVFHEFEPVAPLHTSPTTDSAYPAIAGLLRG